MHIEIIKIKDESYHPQTLLDLHKPMEFIHTAEMRMRPKTEITPIPYGIPDYNQYKTRQSEKKKKSNKTVEILQIKTNSLELKCRLEQS